MEWNGMEWNGVQLTSNLILSGWKIIPRIVDFGQKRLVIAFFPRTTSGLVQVYYRVGPQFVS